MNKVLVVDDMEQVRRSFKRLKLWGEPSGFIYAGEAENGQEALKILESDPFDLVITDIRMPVIDGLELLKKITERKLAHCVVLLSNYTEFSYARQGFIYGAFDYLEKPVDELELSKLLSRVRQYLESGRQNIKKLQELESIAGEKLREYFPGSDVERIVKLIHEGNHEALDVSREMVTKEKEAFHDDLPRAALVLSNALREVTNAVLERNGWMDAFTDTASLRNINLSRHSDWTALGAAVCEHVKLLLSLMLKYTRCHEGNSMVKNVCRLALEEVDNCISVKALSDRLFVSKAHISDMFSRKTGTKLIEYLMMLRIERAKKLIKDGVLRNYEIAERLGYDSDEYFSRLFKKQTGMTPSEFRHK